MQRVQMNTRIDPKLKLIGDEILHRNGYSPSAAVQALWAYLAETNELPSFMPPKDNLSKKADRLRALEEDEGMAYATFEGLSGIRLAHDSALGLSDEELREAEWRDRGELHA